MKQFKFIVGALGVWLLCCTAMAETVTETPTLTVATWGGAYETAQREVMFDAFSAETGVEIRTVAYNGGMDVLQRESVPDVVDMLEADAHLGCGTGALHPFDATTLLDASDGTAPQQDFLPGALLKCGVAHLSFSTLVAFDERAFPGEKPRHIADFFDTTRFPGKRALRKEPSAILEWALLAEGVPRSQVYNLLSTDRGMRLALRRLDTLRGQIVWWSDPDKPAELLADGTVVMASGYNGRFFNAQLNGTPLVMMWDAQIVDRDVWVIPRQTTGQQLDYAKQFVRFATRADLLAELAERIPYGPTRRSAFERIGLHPNAGIPMADHLPTAAYHLRSALFRDTHWYARTAKLRQQRFAEWLAQGE